MADQDLPLRPGKQGLHVAARDLAYVNAGPGKLPKRGLIMIAKRQSSRR